MIGKRFDKWKVLNLIKIDKPGRYYECMCDCGNIRIKAGTELRAGRGKQCSECQYAELYNPSREIGKKYGKWTIVKFIDTYKKSQRYETLCECGEKGTHTASDLRAGKSRQCTLCHNRENAENNKTHGMHQTLIYFVWRSMLQRCSNSNAPFYNRYGGRGIKVCERWNKFENFLEDMGERPEGMTIDRINNDGNYEPNNCRWVTHKENCNNRGSKKAL
jgi:hypothetical protein